MGVLPAEQELVEVDQGGAGPVIADSDDGRVVLRVEARTRTHAKKAHSSQGVQSGEIVGAQMCSIAMPHTLGAWTRTM